MTDGRGLAPWRRRTRLLALLGVLSLAGLLLAACGSSSSSSSTSTSTESESAPPSETSESSTTPAGEPSAEDNREEVTDYLGYVDGKEGSADPSKSPVKIGFVNQQGGAMSYDEATLGAEAAVKYLNENLGGISGHPAELATCFIAAAEEEGQTCGQQLVNDPDVSVVVFGTLAVGGQAFEAVNDGTKPLLLGNGLGPTDTKSKNTFVYNGAASTLLGGMVTYVSEVLKAKNVAVVYPQDPLGASGAKALEAQLKIAGVEFKSVGFADSSTDLIAPMTAAGAQSAEAILSLTSTPPLCIAAAKALESLGSSAPVVTAGSFCFSEEVAKGLGGEAPHWVQGSSQALLTDGSIPDVKAWREASGSVGLSAEDQSDSNSALAWAITMTAARFLNEAGGASATPAQVSKKAEAFEGPMMLGPPKIECGAVPGQPGLCAQQTQMAQYEGDETYKSVSGWLYPPEP